MSAPEDTQPDGPDGVSDAPDDVLKEPQPCKRPAAAKSSSLMKRPASQAAESSKPKAAKSAPKPKAAKSAPKPQAKVKGEPKPKPLTKKQKLAAVFAGEPASAAPADPSIPEEEVEIAEGAEESRDRSKAARFFQLMQGGSLPEAVLSEWQKSQPFREGWRPPASQGRLCPACHISADQEPWQTSHRLRNMTGHVGFFLRDCACCARWPFPERLFLRAFPRQDR